MQNRYLNYIGPALLGALLAGAPLSALALSAGSWDTLVRKIARVADDVPVNKADDVAERLAKSKTTKNLVDDDLIKGGKLTDDMSDAAKKAARSAELMRQLEKGLGGTNPALLKQLDTLDDAAKGTALIMVKGSKQIADTVPDIALRSKLIREGGADLVAASGLYGDDIVKDALRFQSALEAGSMKVPAGKRAVSLADFSATMTRYGEGSVKFFNQYIKPNWKVWVGSGLLAWWVVAPDRFQDTAGDMVQSGIEAVANLAGEITGSMVAGGIEGTGDGLSNLWNKITTAFQNQGIAGVVALALILFGASLFFRRVRYYVLAPFRWLNRERDED